MQKLSEESHKSIIRKFEKRKVYTSFKEIFGGSNIADMKLKVNLIKNFIFYYVLLIILVLLISSISNISNINTHELVSWKTKKVL